MSQPVLIEIVYGSVSIMLLEETPDGIALHPEGRFEAFGSVHQVVVQEGTPPKPRTKWQWTHTPGQHALADTKTKAIAAMLLDRGYAAVPSTAVIPPLF